MNDKYIKMPKSQIVYGDSVYWVCVLSALCCTLGPLFALIGIDGNVLNPHYLFSAIWAGKEPMEVWAVGGGEFPGGHFYLDNFFTGDGFTQFGLALGGGCALPALLLSSVFLFKEKQYLWGFLSWWVCALIVVSAIGIAGAGH